jgi:hypothetical protein
MGIFLGPRYAYCSCGNIHKLLIPNAHGCATLFIRLSSVSEARTARSRNIFVT